MTLSPSVEAARACPRCLARGKNWNGSDPKCGFTKRGRFTTDNWNCATLNELRDLAEKQDLYGNEDRAAIFPRPDGEAGFVVLCWYKSRGRTEQAFQLSSDWRLPLTLRLAEALLVANGVAPVLKPTRSSAVDAARAEQNPGRRGYCAAALPRGHRLVCSRDECQAAHKRDYQRDWKRQAREARP